MYSEFLRVLPTEFQSQFIDIWNELNEFFDLKQFELVFFVLKKYLNMIEKKNKKITKSKPIG